MPLVTDLRLQKTSRLLHVTFENKEKYALTCEYLRVFSPSAEVQGHGPGQEVLIYGKEEVGVLAIEPVGNYAVRIVFDDNHGSGLFTWDYLYQLGKNQTKNWQNYLQRLEQAGYQRKNA